MGLAGTFRLLGLEGATLVALRHEHAVQVRLGRDPDNDLSCDTQWPLEAGAVVRRDGAWWFEPRPQCTATIRYPDSPERSITSAVRLRAGTTLTFGSARSVSIKLLRVRQELLVMSVTGAGSGFRSGDVPISRVVVANEIVLGPVDERDPVVLDAPLPGYLRFTLAASSVILRRGYVRPGVQVLIRGSPVEHEAALSDGDVIEFGEASFQVESAGGRE